MKLLFLGTGAADWSLEVQPDPEYRRFTSTLIDGTLLIDPGPHVLDAIRTFGVDMKGIKYVINTHRHSDHYNEDSLHVLVENGAEFIDFKAGDKKQVGKYFIEAYPANHGKIETVHFFISDGEKILFYGLDGSWLMPDESYGLVKKGVDYAILDGTLGDVLGDIRIIEHNDLGMIRELVGALKPYVKRFCINHYAKQYFPTREVTDAFGKALGVDTTFDGLEREI